MTFRISIDELDGRFPPDKLRELLEFEFPGWDVSYSIQAEFFQVLWKAREKTGGPLYSCYSPWGLAAMIRGAEKVWGKSLWNSSLTGQQAARTEFPR